MNQVYRGNAYLAEAVGTFIFFFIGIGAGYAVTAFIDPGAAAGSQMIVAFAHGLALLVVVSAFGAVSGGHFNPAVTFGVWITGKIDPLRAVGYVASQLIGAIAAAALAAYIFSGLVLTEGAVTIETSMAVPALHDGIDPLKGIIIEAVATMGLLAAVLGTAVDGRGPKIGGIAIGLSVAAGILVAGGLTGGALNPARWFGPAVVAMDWTNALVWIVGPLLGAGIVAAIYRTLFLPEADATAS